MSLIHLATRAAERQLRRAQRYARREFGKTSVGKLAATISRTKRRSKRFGKTIGKIKNAVASGKTEEIKRRGGVEKYAIDLGATEALDELFDTLGPLGDILRTVISDSKSGRLEDQINVAQEFLNAFGVDTDKDFADLVGDAQEIQADGPTTRADQGPRVVYDPPTEDEQSVYGKEIRTPGSSNVYSFSFHHESRTRGILYVTFKAWAPGMQQRHRHGRGPMYAYYDVPVSAYQQFRKAAASSAGKAVWDYLRVRGSSHAHQYQYNLQQGAVLPQVVKGGEYIPRKATPRGFRTRALASVGTGKRGFKRSTLPESIRGEPNRGEPNRGTPNRGRP